MNRRTARKHLFSIIFQGEFHREEEMPSLTERYFEALADEDESEKQYILDGVQGVLANRERIDATIGQHAKDWSFERLAKADIAILRLAVYELTFTDVPRKVAVNEAVEIAKRYSTDDSPSFINGILRSVLLGLGDAEE